MSAAHRWVQNLHVQQGLQGFCFSPALGPVLLALARSPQRVVRQPYLLELLFESIAPLLDQWPESVLDNVIHDVARRVVRAGGLALLLVVDEVGLALADPSSDFLSSLGPRLDVDLFALLF